MFVCLFNILFTLFEMSLMLKLVLKDVIKIFKISKLFYNDKRIITTSIFLIEVCDFKK